MSFRIERNNITKVSCEAIVNTANPNPIVGRGTDTVVYEAAGLDELLTLRREIGVIERGQSEWTPSLNLKKEGIKYIIHTVGVPYGDGKSGQIDILRSCYSTSLNLALELGCKSVAIPLLATGNYQFPKELAFEIAVDEISRFLNSLEKEIEVVLVVYDDESYKVSEHYYNDIESFIGNSSYISQSSACILKGEFFEPFEAKSCCIKFDEDEEGSKEIRAIDVDAFISSSEDELNFQNTLQKMIADRNLSNAEIYKKAGVDRKFFSKIINNKDYIPKKEIVMALGLALQLPLDQFEEFLATAGYAIMPSRKFDLIVKYCVINQIYNLVKVDVLLHDHKQKCFSLN